MTSPVICLAFSLHKKVTTLAISSVVAIRPRTVSSIAFWRNSDGIFFAISVILSLVGWTGLARQVRAKVLSYREMDYTMAAKASGGSDLRIIFVHMLPNAASHIIVVASLAIPGMILAETALSFLGLGIQPPMVSWGTLLQDAQQVNVIIQYPWHLIPGLFVIVAVLAFNFVGDGLRDAVDPYAV